MEFIPQDAKEWIEAGFNLPAAVDWRTYAFEPTAAQHWRDAGFGVGDAVVWRKHAFGPAEAKRWKATGRSPLEAADRKRAGGVP